MRCVHKSLSLSLSPSLSLKFFGLWRIRFPPVLVRTGRRLPVQALGERGVLVIKYAQNIKGQPPLTMEKILESGAFMTMETVPESQRVYKSCIYPVACLIIVMYVDNNGVRHNCEELLAQFEADVAADGRIDLQREGDMSSFLSVRYLNNPETGEITAVTKKHTSIPCSLSMR